MKNSNSFCCYNQIFILFQSTDSTGQHWTFAICVLKMSDEENAAKRQRLNHSAESEENSIAGPSNEPIPSMPKIFKLDIDCFDEIFEYLSLRDLHSFGQTCKTMQKVAGEYFKRNYSAAETYVKGDGIETVCSDGGATNGRTSTTAFSQFITSISHSNEYRSDAALPWYIASHSEKFDAINELNFVGITLDEQKASYFKPMLHKIETVRIKNCWLRGDLHENLLRYCIKIKRLILQQTRSRYLFRLENNIQSPWMHRRYYSLEHLEVIPAPSVKNLELFFNNNPWVRSLSTNTPSIYTRVALMQTNIQLDLLEVKDAHGFRPIPKTFDAVLKRLYDRGFFKRLHFYTYDIDQSHSELLASLPALEKLCIRNWTECFSLTQLTNLKELAILDRANANDMKILANSLVNLQRVYIENATIDDIMPFIRHAPKLIKLKVIPKDETHFNAGRLKLKTLDKERQQLFGAHKVTIYVPGNVFLKTKWATEHGNTNLALIEIRPSDSYEWNQHYF